MVKVPQVTGPWKLSPLYIPAHYLYFIRKLSAYNVWKKRQRLTNHPPNNQWLLSTDSITHYPEAHLTIHLYPKSPKQKPIAVSKHSTLGLSCRGRVRQASKADRNHDNYKTTTTRRQFRNWSDGEESGPCPRARKVVAARCFTLKIALNVRGCN